MTSVTGAVADFVANTPASAIPDKVRANAVDTIVDAYGTALAGYREPAPQTIVKALLPRAGQGKSKALGVTDRRVDPASAALFNGAAAHALDYDAISFAVSGFVGSPALFALAALADEGEYSGSEVITAYCLGWEAAAALGRALNPEHYAMGWHPTSTLGLFAATLASSRLLGLDSERTVAALSVAVSEASGVKIMIGNMINAYHVGKAARNGVNAALLAQSGFIGHVSPLDFDQGFLKLFSGPSGDRRERITESLGNTWDLEEPGPVFKVYACCGLIHSGLDAVLTIVEAENLSPDDVLGVVVKVHEYVPRVMHVTEPTTGYAAKFCIPYCVAAAIRDRRVGLSAFDDVDPELVQLGKRVSVQVHPDLREGGSFFAKEFTEVEIDTTRGRFSHRVRRLENRGSGYISNSMLREKFAECAQRALPDDSSIEADFVRLKQSEQAGTWTLWSM